MIKKILTIMMILITITLVVGCEGEVVINDEDINDNTEEVKEPAVVEEVEEPQEEVITEKQEEVIEEEPEEIIFKSCTKNDECEWGEYCIDEECKKIDDLYNTNCDEKCSITEVKISTSDGEDYTLPLGQGSYSYAGALEWKLMSAPAYCKGDQPLVPIKLIKKNAGKILEEQVISLKEGATSKIITHPTIKSVQFTAALVDAVEDCS